jgi:two-component system OmpR family response regulator
MKLLVAEHEPRLQRALAQALREQGYAVDTASDTATTIEKARAERYDTVLADLLMPALDGITVGQRLCDHPGVFLLRVTIRPAVTERLRALNGASTPVVRPFDLSDLLARVRALVYATMGRGRVTPVGDLSIDTPPGTVAWRGRVVALTARERAILEYLTLHRGRVISRDELNGHLRGTDVDTLSNLVDVHVAAIRRKLWPGLIATRRGEGYGIE